MGLGLMLAALGFQACVSDIDNGAADRGRIALSITGDISTKTYIEHDGDVTYVPSWNSNDQIGVFTTYMGTEENVKEPFTNMESSGSTARFNGTLSPTTTLDKDIVLYSYYPYSCGATGSFNNFNMSLPSVQTPVVINSGDTSFDPAADIMASLPATFSVSQNGQQDLLVPLKFKRFMSYTRMVFNVTNTQVSGDEKVKSVTFTVPGQTLTGDFSMDLSVPEIKSFGTGENYVSSTYGDATQQSIKDLVCWLVVNPFVIPNDGSASFTIRIETDQHVITKSVNYAGSKPISFLAGEITPITVSVNSGVTIEDIGGPTASYELVTTEEFLVDGDYIIVGINSGKYYTFGTSANNNIPAIEVTSLYQTDTGLFIDDAEGTLADAEVKITELANGNRTIQYKAESDQYLYAASSGSNHLRLRAANSDANSEWLITPSSGKTVMTAQGSNTRNIIRFNTTNNPPLFSCYSTGQTDVYLYRNTNNTQPVGFMVSAGNLDILPSAAGSFAVTVTSTVDWTVSSDNPEFVPSPQQGSGNGVVTISYARNTSATEDRTVNITFTTTDTSIPAADRQHVITVTQSKMVNLVYSTGFESSEGFVSTTQYNQPLRLQGPEGKQWGVYYGTASTTDPIAGSQSMQMRWYKSNEANIPYTETSFDIQDPIRVTFQANNTSNNNLRVDYSADGGVNWQVGQTYTLSSSANTFEYIVPDGVSGSVRFRFNFVLGTSEVDKSRVTIDEVHIYTSVE